MTVFSSCWVAHYQGTVDPRLLRALILESQSRTCETVVESAEPSTLVAYFHFV